MRRAGEALAVTMRKADEALVVTTKRAGEAHLQFRPSRRDPSESATSQTR